MSDKYSKLQLSFTYVDLITPSNESPCSCKLPEEMVKIICNIMFKDHEKISCKTGDDLGCTLVKFIAKKSFQETLSDITGFRGKHEGKVYKIADLAVCAYCF